MNKLILILVPVALLGVGVVLVMTGVINIPGVSPKAKKAATAMYAQDKEAALKKTTPDTPKEESPSVASKPKISDTPAVPATLVVPELGDKRLASLWNEVPVAKLKEITADWKDEDLVKVLAKMEPDKVAELMNAVDTKRASKLSKALQKQASVVAAPVGNKSG